MKTKYFDIEATNNHSELGLDLRILTITLLFQYIKAISYIGVVIGTKCSRVSVFTYVLPSASEQTRKFHTHEILIDSGNDGIVTTKYHQWGRSRLLGIEHVKISGKDKQC